ncbi:MAG: chromophore lyase CpcT/CpeT [Cyanophyceae cyanobacterium]
MFSSKLKALGQYLAGEFDNRQQAIENPAWYVHLRLWKRPVPIFTEDSLALYAEQVNMIHPDNPYRPRLLRLRQHQETLQVRYYMLKDMAAFKGAGQNPERLSQLTSEQVEFLPECTLNVAAEPLAPQRYRFRTSPASGEPCSFTYQGNRIKIALGFEVTADELLIFDKGIDPNTGKATWGALMGPFRLTKRQDFAGEFPV